MIHGDENDVVVLGLKIETSSFATASEDTSDSAMKVESITINLDERNDNIPADDVHRKHTFVGGAFKNNRHNSIVVHKKNLVDTLSKPRRAFQGRENYG